MTKVLLGFQLISSFLIHLLCCGVPILISLSGGLSIFAAFQTLKPALVAIQLVVFCFTFYQVYKPTSRISKKIRKQRIVFWILLIVSVALFFYPPAHWFKSEETRLKQAQIERFFKHKTQ